MIEELILRWLNMVQKRQLCTLLCQYAMFVLDSFRGHVTEKVKVEVNGLRHSNRVNCMLLPAVCKRVLAAWCSVPPEIFEKSFRVTEISSDVDGSGDFMISDVDS